MRIQKFEGKWYWSLELHGEVHNGTSKTFLGALKGAAFIVKANAPSQLSSVLTF